MSERIQRARGGSEALQAQVDELAEELRRSVVLDDPLVRLICSSRHFGDEDPVRIRSLLQGRADNEPIRYILDLGVAQWTAPGFIEGRDDLGLLTRYCVPLRERGVLLGLLMVVAPGRSLPEHATEAIARVVPAMAAQMYAEHLAATAEESGERELLPALLGRGATARATAQQKIVDSGLLRNTAETVVTLVQVSRSPEPPGQVELALQGALEKYRQTRWGQGIVAVAPERAVLLQAFDRPTDPQDLADQSARILEALGTFLDPAAAPVIGVGGRQSGLADAWISYEQAAVAARAARRLPRLKGAGDWEELGEFAVLLQLPDHTLNESLLPKALRVLLGHTGGDRLVETLRTFLDHAGSIPRTAEALQIHRTSLYYRLRQIQEITGLDLDSGADRLVLHTGLRLQDLLASPDDDARA
ncbi:CdaR family transcriptional regulator [Streptomyces sp. NBC_00102]|uniref:PucR family transcriptional regulator n=1 Tax=Streptomyces sp. NBC_00102 TaxID=2975652 RepID=UPI0022585BEB|nr:helix-turn-helix domain-containing protein [Streptomyces sp. NBC_00102]MCX5399514.1 helix-turn-helix domain-containing protein [Streptomyces sp. NBC_00102]